MSRRQTTKKFELLSASVAPNNGARWTDLVVDHLLVLVAFLQGSAKLYNIRVLRVAVSKRHMGRHLTYNCVELIASPIEAQHESA